MDIGNKLKFLRISQNLTQEELANRSELTKGFISQVERNLTSPSVATLIDILEALGTSPNEFFSDMEEKIVFKEEDYFENENDELKYNLQWIVPNAQKNLIEPTLITIKPGGRSEEIPPFEGQVMGYVLRGNIELVFGENIQKLKSRETFYFTAKKNHYIKNTAKTDAKVIWIASPPNF